MELSKEEELKIVKKYLKNLKKEIKENLKYLKVFSKKVFSFDETTETFETYNELNNFIQLREMVFKEIIDSIDTIQYTINEPEIKNNNFISNLEKFIKDNKINT